MKKKMKWKYILILMILILCIKEDVRATGDVSDGGTTFTIVLGPPDSNSSSGSTDTYEEEVGSQVTPFEEEEEETELEEGTITSPQTGDQVRELVKMVCIGIMCITGVLLLYELYGKRKRYSK